MGVILFAVFVGVPILEISLFIEVGGRIGLWPTIGVVILTAFAGTVLLRSQGLSTLRRAQANLEDGRFPMDEVFDGLCLVVAGALLLTPGFFTDGVGLALFVPPFRMLLRRFASSYLVASGRVEVHSSGSGFGPGPGSVIDGEFEDITPQESPEGKEKKNTTGTLPPEERPPPD
ncbi:MAG: FxsA family protein [Rhodospirillales bacterium]|nr:FxsA family protein [Alphaproteobacteria bacterium]MBL6948868.1 FxsA family protein [Rhodospirillales bacterium]